MDECSCCHIHTAQYCFDLLYMCTKPFVCMLSGETDVKLSAGPTAVSDEASRHPLQCFNIGKIHLCIDSGRLSFLNCWKDQREWDMCLLFVFIELHCHIYYILVNHQFKGYAIQIFFNINNMLSLSLSYSSLFHCLLLYYSFFCYIPSFLFFCFRLIFLLVW